MLFEKITLLDENLEIIENAYVGTRDDKIAYISTEKPTEDFGECYDGSGKLLMSGFYNCHAHTPMTLLRGYGENMALQDWLEKRMFPFESLMSDDDAYWGMMLGLAELLKFGVVSTTEMYAHSEFVVKALLDAKAKSNIGRGILNFGDENLVDLDCFEEAKTLHEKYNGAGDGRVVVDMSLHAEFTSKPKVAAQLAEYTSDIGAHMHLHLSETKREHEECKARHGGMTPAEYFKDVGLLDNPTTAAHCVWIDGNDFDILAEKGVTVASCPISNLKLASGVCNVPKLLDMGISVGVGTDGVASNNNLNYLEDMKFFALASKGAFYDPTVISPKQTIYSATRIGALSQGRDDCGAIKVGNKADIIVLDISTPNFWPIHDYLGNIVYSTSGGDIKLTMVDGNVLYKDGIFPTIDIEQVRYHVGESVTRILGDIKQ